MIPETRPLIVKQDTYAWNYKYAGREGPMNEIPRSSLTLSKFSFLAIERFNIALVPFIWCSLRKGVPTNVAPCYN